MFPKINYTFLHLILHSHDVRRKKRKHGVKIMKSSRKPLIYASMILLILVVLAMGGVTFAKYISKTGVETNGATISKWGIVLKADASALFGGGRSTASSDGDAGQVTSSGNADRSFIAPGTDGYMTFSVSGEADVASKIDVDVEYDDIRIGTSSAPKYVPLRWTLKKDGSEVEGAKDLTLSEMAEYLEKMDESVPAGNKPKMSGEYVLEWRWEKNAQNDEFDTVLGKVASGEDKTTLANTEISLSITIRAVQVKE